jgi:Family of unknown function (DUF5309)
MALFQTYEQVGIKEDISDIISNISPTQTPFQTAIGNEKVTNTLFQWQEDTLRNVASNPVLEGADASFITVQPTVMRNNHTQIFAEAVQVSGTTDAVSTYGRARESAYQLAKSAKALKRDLENAFVGTAQAAVAGADATARQMASYQVQTDTSTNVYTGGTSTAPTEANFLTCLQEIFVNGADPTIIQVTPANSVIFAGFAAAAGRYRTLNTGGDDKALVNVVNLYVSPFGQQKVQVNRWLKASDSLVFDPSMWSKVTLRPWTRETLAKTGDSLKQMIVGEFSLKHKNQKASGLVIEQVSSGY